MAGMDPDTLFRNPDGLREERRKAEGSSRTLIQVIFQAAYATEPLAGIKWDARALTLQEMIMNHPRVDELSVIFDSGSEDELEGLDAYMEVEAILHRFNLPPKRTLNVLQQGRGYMSGSGVIASQARRLQLPSFKPGDLDFYIQERESEHFKEFLLESGERRLVKELDFTQPLAVGHEYNTGYSLPVSTATQTGTFAQRRISKLWYFCDAYDNEINVIVTASR